MVKLSLDFEKIWQRHENLYTDLFLRSLRMLSRQTGLTGQEDDISIILWDCLKKTCKSLAKDKELEVPCPIFQVPVQSVSMAKKTSANALKKPDFSCFRYNPFTASAVALHVECKLLGKPKPSSPSWKFNENYVTNGIKRFDSDSHQYGTHASSGMMIGYVISMAPEAILDEVNNCQKHRIPNNHPIVFDFHMKPAFQARQALLRKTVKPRSFSLIHIWVDVRNSYQL